MFCQLQPTVSIFTLVPKVWSLTYPACKPGILLGFGLKQGLAKRLTMVVTLWNTSGIHHSTSSTKSAKALH